MNYKQEKWCTFRLPKLVHFSVALDTWSGDSKKKAQIAQGLRAFRLSNAAVDAHVPTPEIAQALRTAATLRMVAGYQRFPPCAVGTPSAFSFAAIEG